MNIKIMTFFGLVASMITPITILANDLHPVVDFHAGYLLGSTSANKWVKTDALVKSKTLPGQRKYRIYSSSRYLGEVTGTKAVSMGAPCEDTRFVEFSPKPTTNRYKNGVLAISGSWNALPRVPRQQSTTQPTYRALVSNLLKSKGIKNPTVRIAQVLRVDLEGDGAAEVLINATNHQGSNGLSGSISSNSRAGEYSMILLRKIVNGKAQTTLIEGDFYPQAKTFNAPNVFKILGAFDVNGDGKMEIVTKGGYYEGDSTTVYAVSANNSSKVLTLQDVLGDGCGA